MYRMQAFSTFFFPSISSVLIEEKDRVFNIKIEDKSWDFPPNVTGSVAQ